MIKRILKFLVTIILLVSFYIALPISYDIKIEGVMDESQEKTLLWNRFILRLADSNDTVYIHINSPGGLLFQGIEIINEIKDSSAHTVSVNEGMAASAAALIAISCDEITSKEFTFYLFHRPFFITGNGGKVLLPSDHPGEMIATIIMKEKMFLIFTTEEFQTYVSGGDVIILGSDLIKRINNG